MNDDRSNVSEWFGWDDSGYHMNNSNISKWWKWDETTLELPGGAQAGLITLYASTILLSITGNLLVIIVLLSANRTRTEITVFLVNLAVADMCMACFCMPFTFTQALLGRWIFGHSMCPLVRFMQIISVAVSIFTNMAIGIDRFWGVKFPMKPRITNSMACLVLVVIWMSACVLASPQITDCEETWSTEARSVYTVVIALCTYFIPLGILAAVYTRIGTILWTHRAPGNADGARDQIMLRSKRKVVKMVVTLVIVFAVCWLPLQTWNIVLDLAPQLMDVLQSTTSEYLDVWIYFTCHWMAMANSFTNPIIFCFLNDNFRADMKSVLRCSFRIGRFIDSQRSSIRSTRSLLVRLPARAGRKRNENSRSSSSQPSNEVAQPNHIVAVCHMSDMKLQPFLTDVPNLDDVLRRDVMTDDIRPDNGMFPGCASMNLPLVKLQQAYVRRSSLN